MYKVEVSLRMRSAYPNGEVNPDGSIAEKAIVFFYEDTNLDFLTHYRYGGNKHYENNGTFNGETDNPISREVTGEDSGGAIIIDEEKIKKFLVDGYNYDTFKVQNKGKAQVYISEEEHAFLQTLMTK